MGGSIRSDCLTGGYYGVHDCCSIYSRLLDMARLRRRVKASMLEPRVTESLTEFCSINVHRQPCR